MIALHAVVGLLGEINVAGSIYLNQPTLLSDRDAALGGTMRGMNAESAVKLVADVNEHLSASVKVCYGCHGFTADQAHFDWTLRDEVGLRVGRFPVPFGEFYLRHDPANHRSASKPLPYEMGRMLHRDAFNLAVVPEPYPDNGVELFGTVRGEVVELSYSAYAVAGLKGSATTGDLDFIDSRLEPFADNNRTPSVGGRVVVALTDPPTAVWRWFAVGLSALYGNYDDEDELWYAMGGLDVYARVGQVNVRGEVLFRRTEQPANPALFRTALEDRFVQREGFYFELDGPLGRWLEWLVRVDGFRRSGPLLLTSVLESEDTHILRGTAGLNLLPATGVTVKLGYEYWQFKDFADESIIHTGLVGTF